MLHNFVQWCYFHIPHESRKIAFNCLNDLPQTYFSRGIVNEWTPPASRKKQKQMQHCLFEIFTELTLCPHTRLLNIRVNLSTTKNIIWAHKSINGMVIITRLKNTNDTTHKIPLIRTLFRYDHIFFQFSYIFNNSSYAFSIHVCHDFFNMSFGFNNPGGSSNTH